ncbi:MAG: hypothetical protein J0J01_06875 [Reyranella sp.]|uniref:hypothetical protein n=1 Tax=Reyranella sp. TaxID=1929291 RepID=UPI001AD0B609|nr:hypothetical protein [Reyranella sp.]MBN9086613.1 hypothetical protein [Reyranella sp.]
MLLRKSFQEFLVLHSEAEPMPLSQPRPQPAPQPAPQGEDREPAPPRRRVIDWRWLAAREDVP